MIHFILRFLERLSTRFRCVWGDHRRGGRLMCPAALPFFVAVFGAGVVAECPLWLPRQGLATNLVAFTRSSSIASCFFFSSSSLRSCRSTDANRNGLGLVAVAGRRGGRNTWSGFGAGCARNAGFDTSAFSSMLCASACLCCRRCKFPSCLAWKDDENAFSSVFRGCRAGGLQDCLAGRRAFVGPRAEVAFARDSE